jgi:predicted RNase H-like HicB family nuclease
MNTSGNTNTILTNAALPESKMDERLGLFTRGIDTSVQRGEPVFCYGISQRMCVVVESLSPTQEVIYCEISSFSPEPYALKSPIKIKIVGNDSEYIASYHESNIHASGDTPYEAIENLKSLLLDTFDSLTSEPRENLGIKAKNQRALLESIIERQ